MSFDKLHDADKNTDYPYLYQAWLDHAHQALDEAVAEAYGWPVELSEDDILARLFALNQERAKAEAKAGKA